jgi:enamine deaminase RidA (YjgF/YER057c/UK114 family)
MGSKFLRVLVFWSAPANSGISPDDRVPETVEEQTHLCFRNIGAVLEHAGLSFKDIVRINAFVVSART